MFNKTRHKVKKCFCKSCLQCFSSKKVLKKHKKDCLMINGAQNVKLEKGFIEFKNFNRQIPVPFKIYADFECLLKSCNVGVDIKTTLHVVLLIKMLYCTEVKIQCLNLFNVFSKSMIIAEM